MRKSRRYLAIGALSVGLASLVAYAAQPSLQRAISSPSATATATDQPQSLSPVMPSTARPPVAIPIPLPPLPPGTPLREDVGDADSFGRPLKWLGLTQANIHLSEDCSLPEHQSEGTHCEQTSPGQTARFDFRDTARITLPGNAAHSIERGQVHFCDRKGVQSGEGSFFRCRAWPAAGPNLPVPPASAFTCLWNGSLP